jgi:hypothetical protein
MRGRRRSRSTNSSDDVVGMAGWMYTDLLLALAVVFLGSIAILVYGSGPEGTGGPEENPPEEPAEETTTSTTSSTLPPVECTILYSLANME